MTWALVYAACVVGANAATTWWGPVPVGFGLVAPAGVYCAGLCFTARDLVQESSGRGAAGAAVLLGAALSAAWSPSLALASGLAFAASEGLDLLVYSRLRERSWVAAIVASNLAGLLVDSLVFLQLAFGSTALWRGQAVGKLWMTALAVPVVWWLRRRRLIRAGEGGLDGGRRT